MERQPQSGFLCELFESGGGGGGFSQQPANTFVPVAPNGTYPPPLYDTSYGPTTGLPTGYEPTPPAPYDYSQRFTEPGK